MDEGKCITHDLWAELNDIIFNYLGSVTLKQLIDDQKKREQQQNQSVVKLYDMREAAF